LCQCDLLCFAGQSADADHQLRLSLYKQDDVICV